MKRWMVLRTLVLVIVVALASGAAMAQGASKFELYPPIESTGLSYARMAVTASGVTVFTNALGQFTLQRAADGKWLLYPSPSTTYLSVNIDGAIYTNLPGGGLTVASQSGTTFVYNPVMDVEITESLSVEGDALKCEVKAENVGSADRTVQARFLFDTQVDDNDGAPLYAAGQHYTYEVQFEPPTFDEWRSWRRPDDQSVVGVGTLDQSTTKVVFAHWPPAFDTYWSYAANPNERFYTPGYTTSPQSDSAVLVYLDLGRLRAQEQAARAAWYGIGRGVPGATARDQVCQAFAGLAAAIRGYQEGAINVFANGDVEFARSVAEHADLTQTAIDFAEDLLAAGTPTRIIGKMTTNAASETGRWIAIKMVPELGLKIISSGARWLANWAIDWTSLSGGVPWQGGDEQIASYLDSYFRDPSRLGAILDGTSSIAGEFCAGLPTPLPLEFPTAEVVRELGRLESSVRNLKPIIGRPLERDVYWAVPGLCSLTCAYRPNVNARIG